MPPFRVKVAPHLLMLGVSVNENVRAGPLDRGARSAGRAVAFSISVVPSVVRRAERESLHGFLLCNCNSREKP